MNYKSPFYIFFVFACLSSAMGQEVGANFNHNPEIMDFDYLEKAEVEWVRTTPRIFEYINGELEVQEDPGLSKVVEAGERGYKVAFGFRWDFRKNNQFIPEPGSAEEDRLFEKAREILEVVGPYTDIFKLGNEPNLETLPEDMKVTQKGYIPLVRFTERLLTKVIEPYYEEYEEYPRPAVYVGSFPRLFMEEEQQDEAVRAMISLANENSAIEGLAVHLHISESSQIDQSFEFVRSLMPEKPIIVSEFSFHRLYTQKLDNPLVQDASGRAFAMKYNRNPDWKLYEWFGYANTHKVSRKEWQDLFNTLDWYPHHNLLIYYDRFQKYGVVLATYPLFQQSAPKNMTADSPAWFINPIFAQKSIERNSDGTIASNPLHYSDFLRIVRQGKAETLEP